MLLELLQNVAHLKTHGNRKFRFNRDDSSAMRMTLSPVIIRLLSLNAIDLHVWTGTRRETTTGFRSPCPLEQSRRSTNCSDCIWRELRWCSSMINRPAEHALDSWLETLSAPVACPSSTEIHFAALFWDRRNNLMAIQNFAEVCIMLPTFQLPGCQGATPVWDHHFLETLEGSSRKRKKQKNRRSNKR